MRVSELLTFVQCKRKWFLQYRERIPVEESKAQSLGTAVHKAVGVYHLDPSPQGEIDSLWAIEQACLTEEETTLGRNMMHGYHNFNKVDPTLHSYLGLVLPGLELEHEAKVVLPSGIIEGHIDMVFSRRKDQLTLIETKTSSSIWDISSFYRNLQTKAYAVMLLDRPVDEVEIVFNILLKDFPQMPKINKPDKKTGIQTVSRSKCSTTKALYLEAIKSVNGDPEDYADHIASIVDKQYFSRFSYKPTYDEYKSWLDMFEAILDDYNYTLKQGIYPYPSPSFMCSYCPFEGVCISGDSPFEATRYKNNMQLLKEASQ